MLMPNPIEKVFVSEYQQSEKGQIQRRSMCLIWNFMNGIGAQNYLLWVHKTTWPIRIENNDDKDRKEKLLIYLS